VATTVAIAETPAVIIPAAAVTLATDQMVTNPLIIKAYVKSKLE
jgi:hypothetical protein